MLLFLKDEKISEIDAQAIGELLHSTRENDAALLKLTDAIGVLCRIGNSHLIGFC